MPRKKPEDPSKVRVRVLGATEITVGHRRIGMNTEQLFALALYLTTRAGEPIPREELLRLFWLEGSDEDHRHALRQQMYRLRQKGFEVDDAGELIQLDPARVESDLRSALAESWWETASEDAISQACEWGPAFARHKVPAFHEWLDAVRDSVGQNVRRASLRQIGIARREGRWADLDRWGRVILKTDPLNEEGTLARAESAAMAGSKTIALEIIDNYLSEIGDVSPDLGKPVLQMRKRIAERRPDWAMRGPKEVPLVGRTELMTKLTGLVEDVWKGEGRAVVLTGAAGIGKTRLAMEARAYAELKGMRTVMVRSETSNAARPLSVAQRLIAALLDLPGAAGCHPDSLRLLQMALERSRTLSRHDVTSYMFSISSDVPDAVIDLVEAISHESRLLIIVDDAHLADPTSASTLSEVCRATAGSRVGWLSTSRDSSMETGDSSSVLHVHVGGLAATESASLATSTGAQHGIAVSAITADSVARAAGGNPLFVRELAVAGRARPNQQRLPETLSRVIETRLQDLGGSSRDLLRVIALLGSEATLDRIERALSTTHASGLTNEIELLERDGILAFTDSGSLLLHDCWRQSVLDSMSGATRATIGRRCAQAICAIAEKDRSPHATWKAAELFAESGDTRQSVDLFMHAAEGLYGAGLPTESVQVLRMCQKLPCPESDRLVQRAMLVTALVASGDPLSAIAESSDEIAERLLTSKTTKNHAAQLLCSRTDALFKAGHPISREIDLLLGVCTDPDIDQEKRARCSLAGIAWATNVNDYGKRDAFASAVAPNSTSTAARLVRLIFHAECGPIEALDAAIAALTPESIAAESPYLRCRALRIKCRALRILSRSDEALDVAIDSLATARGALLAYDAAIVSEQMVHLHLDRGDVASARECLDSLKSLQGHQTFERMSALEHARERLCLQSGQFALVVANQVARDTSIRADCNPLRKLVELSTRAHALAQLDRIEDAAKLTEEVYELALPLLGQVALDYPVELSVRTMRILGQSVRATNLSRSHVDAAIRVMPRDFAAFYEALIESRAELFSA